MALRAGYYGLKKSVVRKLMDLSESLIIKRLGTALSLTSAGELRIRNATNNQSGIVQPDGETIIIEDNLLKVAGGAVSIDDLYVNEGTSNPSTVQLNTLLDYDIVFFVSYTNAGGYKWYRSVPLLITGMAEISDTIMLSAVYGSDQLNYALNTDRNLITFVSSAGSVPILRKIVGIKY